MAKTPKGYTITRIVSLDDGYVTWRVTAPDANRYGAETAYRRDAVAVAVAIRHSQTGKWGGGTWT